jgi:hypothetical protein
MQEECDMDIYEVNANPTDGEQRSVTRPYEKTMPKWHASWESIAFEAISKKKALILSPPEVYAEITHLGYEKAQYPWAETQLDVYLEKNKYYNQE